MADLLTLDLWKNIQTKITSKAVTKTDQTSTTTDIDLSNEVMERVRNEAYRTKRFHKQEDIETIWRFVDYRKDDAKQSAISQSGILLCLQDSLGLSHEEAATNIEGVTCNENNLIELLQDPNLRTIRKFPKLDWIVAIIKTKPETKLGDFLRENPILEWLLSILNDSDKCYNLLSMRQTLSAPVTVPGTGATVATTNATTMSSRIDAFSNESLKGFWRQLDSRKNQRTDYNTAVAHLFQRLGITLANSQIEPIGPGDPHLLSNIIHNQADLVAYTREEQIALLLKAVSYDAGGTMGGDLRNPGIFRRVLQTIFYEEASPAPASKSAATATTNNRGSGNGLHGTSNSAAGTPPAANGDGKPKLADIVRGLAANAPIVPDLKNIENIENIWRARDTGGQSTSGFLTSRNIQNIFGLKVPVNLKYSSCNADAIHALFKDLSNIQLINSYTKQDWLFAIFNLGKGKDGPAMGDLLREPLVFNWLYGIIDEHVQEIQPGIFKEAKKTDKKPTGGDKASLAKGPEAKAQDGLIERIRKEARGAIALLTENSISELFSSINGQELSTIKDQLNHRRSMFIINDEISLETTNCGSTELKELLKDPDPRNFKKFSKAEWLITIFRTPADSKLGALLREPEVFNWLLGLLNQHTTVVSSTVKEDKETGSKDDKATTTGANEAASNDGATSTTNASETGSDSDSTSTTNASETGSDSDSTSTTNDGGTGSNNDDESESLAALLSDPGSLSRLDKSLLSTGAAASLAQRSLGDQATLRSSNNAEPGSSLIDLHGPLIRERLPKNCTGVSLKYFTTIVDDIPEIHAKPNTPTLLQAISDLGLKLIPPGQDDFTVTEDTRADQPTSELIVSEQSGSNLKGPHSIASTYGDEIKRRVGLLTEKLDFQGFRDLLIGIPGISSTITSVTVRNTAKALGIVLPDGRSTKKLHLTGASAATTNTDPDPIFDLHRAAPTVETVFYENGNYPGVGYQETNDLGSLINSNSLETVEVYEPRTTSQASPSANQVDNATMFAAALVLFRGIGNAFNEAAELIEQQLNGGKKP